MIASKLNKAVFYVKGMHCASCELIIERKILALKEIKSVKAMLAKNQVIIEYTNTKPTVTQLNKVFPEKNYIFSDQPQYKIKDKKSDWLTVGIISLLIIGIFILLNRLGITGLVNVTTTSSLPALFVFGLLAGISTCAALVGGLILAMSKQWSKIYISKDSFLPHIMFNLGRLISFIVLGALLGLIGQKLQLSLTFTSFLVIAVSLLMFVFGLQMLGVKEMQKFQLTAPKFITRYITDEKKFNGRYLPFLMGALTFFLPCGFTITVQGLALLSGSVIQGALIMLFFALGTLPSLLTIGFSSHKLNQLPDTSNRFMKTAGVLVLFFALFNINSQLNVIGIKSLSDLGANQKISNEINQKGLAPVISGKQILKMDASSLGYAPNYFKVKVGIPVRWEINDTGTNGCTSAVISHGLFDGQINLTPGKVSIKEFTPQTPGKYKFSCWMGMVTGTIEVIDPNNSKEPPAALNSEPIIDSGAKGCGCSAGKQP